MFVALVRNPPVRGAYGRHAQPRPRPEPFAPLVAILRSRNPAGQVHLGGAKSARLRPRTRESTFPSMSTLETIVADLRTLPPPKLEEAATLIHRLREDARTERREALRRGASLLSPEDGAELERIIEENCERIDPRDW